MVKPRWMQNADKKLRFEAIESNIADRTTRDARMRGFLADEDARILGAGCMGDRVRIDCPALTTDDLKRAYTEFLKLTENLKNLVDSEMSAKNKILLLRHGLYACNKDLNDKFHRSRVSYKRP